MIKNSSKPVDLNIVSSDKIDKTPDLVEKGVNRLQVVGIFIHEGSLQLYYHKILQERYRLIEKIMSKELELLYEYLMKRGFIFSGIYGHHSAMAIFIESENATDVSIFSAVNLDLFEEQEGIDMATHLVKLLTSKLF